jgi:hypothetical protein
MTDAADENNTEGSTSGPLLVVPDANILIHGRSLVDLPWAELGRDRIEVVLVPPVIREIDKLKVQTGRPNKAARQLSSEIRALMKEPNRTARIQRDPLVTKRVDLTSVVRAAVGGLDLHHADQALINHALHLAAQGHDVLLLTDDTICAASAEGFGLNAHLISDHWLRDSEPNAAAKEVTSLKAQIARLEAAEPQIDLSFTGTDGIAISSLQVTVTRWPALSDLEVDALMAEVQTQCPPATTFEPKKPRASDALAATVKAQYIGLQSILGKRTIHEPATEKEIATYRDDEYPDWLDEVRAALTDLPESLQEREEWPSVLATASNNGTRPARGTLLTISAMGAFGIEDVKSSGDDDEKDGSGKSAAAKPYALPLPPAPPRGRSRTVGISDRSFYGAEALGRIQHLPLQLPSSIQPKPRESDAFYWREGRDGWVDDMALECATWRHGQTPVTFELRVCPDGLESAEGAIELTVHAENLSTPARAKLPVRIEVQDGVTLMRAKELVAALGRAAAASGRL